MAYTAKSQSGNFGSGAEEQAAVFAVLADATRLKLLKLLCRQRQPDALCVKMLADLLGVTQPAVSQHLRVLRSAGLVKAERRGYRTHYFVNREVLERYRQLALSVLTTEEAGAEPVCPEQCPLTKRS
jgi:DNA-binding transcriptional ArsR family regulator